MTPNQFEMWKKEELENGNVPLSQEDFELVMDMMAMQGLDEYNPNDKETQKNTIFKEDGMALVQTENGLKVFYTDLESVKYEHLLRKQRKQNYMKSKLHLIK